MDFPNKIADILESRRTKAVAALVGLTAGLVKLLQYALPALVQPFATVSLVLLVLVVLYFVWLIIYGLLTRLRPVDDGESNAHQSPANSAYLYTSKRYGIGYNKLQVECVIDLNGSAEVRRTVEVKAYSEIETLDTFLLIPEPSPNDETRSIDHLAVKSLSPTYNVSLKEILEQGRTLHAVMAISPQLTEGVTYRYEMKERLPSRLYAIDLPADKLAKRKTPFDYFGWNINRPTKSLSLRVFFPRRVKPDVYGFEIRYAPAVSGFLKRPTTHHKEQARLARPSLEGPEGGRYSLKWDVDYPMIGLIYILRWEPLKTSQEAR